MDTKIISAFPACGKTQAFKKLNENGYKILDSDSSQFSWMDVIDEVYEMKNRGKKNYKKRESRLEPLIALLSF